MTDQEIEAKIAWVKIIYGLIILVLLYFVSNDNQKIESLEKSVKELQQQIQP